MAKGESGNSGWMGAAAAGIAGGIQGLFQSAGLKRRYKYAKKMADYEHNLQKEMNQYNAGLALQQWKDTNAPAQVEQLRKAGLSTGLIYGMSGAGGTASTNTGAGGSGGDVNLPNEEGFRFMGLEAGLQVAAQKAQIELTKAQAKNVEADTANKAGGEAANLAADVTNKTVQNAIMQVQKEMADIEKNVKNQTAEETIKQAKAATAKIIAEANSAQTKGTVDRETATQIIEQAKLETTKKTIEILAEEAGVRETSAKITKIATEISKLQNDQTIDWGKLNQEQQRTQIQQLLMEFQINEPSQIKKWTDILMPLVMMGALKK